MSGPGGNYIPGFDGIRPGNVPPAISTRGEGPAGGPGSGYSPSGVPMKFQLERVTLAAGALLASLDGQPACTGCRQRPDVAAQIAELQAALGA